MNITMSELFSYDPCAPKYHSREYILILTGGRKTIPVAEIKNIPIYPDEKIWVLSKKLLSLSEDQARLVAQECATKAVMAEMEETKLIDPVIFRSLRTINFYLLGEATEDELQTARVACSQAAFVADSPVQEAYYAVADAAELDLHEGMINCLRMAAKSLAKRTVPPRSIRPWENAFIKESEWQIDRLIEKIEEFDQK